MKTLKWMMLALFGLLLLVVALLALFPAKVAVDWLRPQLGALQLEDVSGTIWQGQAQRVSLPGQLLGALSWQISRSAILVGRLDADVAIDGSAYQGSTRLSARGDTVHLRDTTLRMGAEQLQPALDIPALNLRGTVELQVLEAELVRGFPRQLRGSATWHDAAVDGAAAAQLGELSAEFHTGQDGALVGTVADQGGPLHLDGRFRIGFDGFDVDAVLAARDGNPQVQEALLYVGARQPDDSSLLQVRGTWLSFP